MPPQSVFSSTGLVYHTRRDVPSPTAAPPSSGPNEESSGVVILLAVLGSVLFAVMFFWASKVCYWEPFWTHSRNSRPVEVVWYRNNDSTTTTSEITVPSMNSSSSPSSLSFTDPGASACPVPGDAVKENIRKDRKVDVKN
ncbi:hypothetical protein QBC35DRAFT_501602 [Podospora australis]|uniref:Ig-like domain-containing protein n=1 Tax=Podospora australis TaxID=1536484 RepID=A0AAN6WQ52_9PEZI|nr:hypothetical protein QBC35DRAFT_501602 [Podospora australis]